MRLELSEATLEPRADTEALVELVCDLVTSKGRRDDELAMLDLGTGTGAIALALLTVLKNAKASVTDVDQHALETAMKNARTHGLASRLIALAGSWFNPVEGRFDLIVSNPPYIPSAVVPALDIAVREHDPVIALDGGADGLDPYRAIAAGAAKHLAADGIVAVEIGFDQAGDVTAIFTASGFAFLELRKDMGGRNRALAFALR
jgi:release factor glutamine methyltransferase